MKKVYANYERLYDTVMAADRTQPPSLLYVARPRG